MPPSHPATAQVQVPVQTWPMALLALFGLALLALAAVTVPPAAGTAAVAVEREEQPVCSSGARRTCAAATADGAI